MRALRKLLIESRGGTAFVEFALVMPLMLLLLMGTFLATNLSLVYMKLNDAAEVAVDLVTQCTQLMTADLKNFGTAAQQVMQPLSTASMTISFANVNWDVNGNATQTWHYEVGTSLAISGAVAEVKNLNLIRTGIVGGVVVIHTAYNYTLPFNFTLPGPGGYTYQPFGNGVYTFTENGYSNPRYISQIPVPGDQQSPAVTTPCSG